MLLFFLPSHVYKLFIEFILTSLRVHYLCLPLTSSVTVAFLDCQMKGFYLLLFSCKEYNAWVCS